MIVMKFGGSSVASAELIRSAAGIVKSQVGKKPLVVVSAVGKTTNELIELANSAASGTGSGKCDEIIGRHLAVIKDLGLEGSIIAEQATELKRSVKQIEEGGYVSVKALDNMMSFGERMSARIVASCLDSLGVDSHAYDAFSVGLVTDSNFGSANPLPEGESAMRRSLNRLSCVPVVTGFIGKDRSGDITTLGRGGSDYTASLVGTAVNAAEIQIWTNTNGILTADPRIVPRAENVPRISYEEELELEHLGANTLHPRGIKPAFQRKIPVRVLNTLRPEQEGTVIKSDIPESRRVASITHKDDMQLIHVHTNDPQGKLHGVFDIIKRHGLNVDSVTASRNGILIILSGYYNRNLRDATRELGGMGKVTVKSDRAKVSIVGKSLSTIPGISGRAFSSLERIPIEAISYGSSGISQSFFVKEEFASIAIRKLHKEFFGA
ncbi:MAG: aspartate kinase [Candidatus Micrarchaeota archaeon]|nr:aspartate kinase [Candidatus Micrarchaeota archaeon]